VAQVKMLRIASATILPLIVVALLSMTAAAQSAKVEGVIKARDGSTMVLQTASSPSLVVLLTDNTQVGQVQGVFQARQKQMAMTALIPGLNVKVEGSYNEQDQLVATSVSFKGNDLKSAQSMQAGMHETKMQAQRNKEELEKHNAELKAQNEALQQQQAKLTEQQAKLAENRAAIEAAIARFGQLDDYYIFDAVTVYFANAKSNIDPTYSAQLLALAEKARTFNGYMLEVKGYASSIGSAALNQRLSQDRAGNVTNFLIQQGRVPLTRILAPGAMGTSEQVGNDQTATGQAQNRRVVVRILQNKAIAAKGE
jgi:OOP family OmpA-OmpF porin